ncbi:MAG: RAS1 protein, partial [Paramarteilia canceri]
VRALLNQDFLGKHNPTLQDTSCVQVSNGTEEVQVDVVDTAGTEDFGALKNAQIEINNGFVIVASIDDKESIDEALTYVKKIKEGRLADKDKIIPICLVLNKSDIDEKYWKITFEEFKAHFSKILSAEIDKKFVGFYKISCKQRENVKESFEFVVKKIYEESPKKSLLQKMKTLLKTK